MCGILGGRNCLSAFQALRGFRLGFPSFHVQYTSSDTPVKGYASMGFLFASDSSLAETSNTVHCYCLAILSNGSLIDESS